ncbi:MAG TPA: hypothetical protein PLA97_14965 [Rubrivivax sp.]|nr:hypothetical protein [Rubrivivax sp.]
MRRIRLNLRLAGLVLLGLAAPSGWAAGASQIIGGLAVLHIESTVDGQRDLCARRFADSTAEWQTAVASWKQRQAAELDELRAIVTSLGAGPAQPGAATAPPAMTSKALMVRSFQLVSLLQAATALAALNDGPGAALCADWRAGLAVGGPMEQNLPRAIEAARKLVPAVR